MIPIFTGKFTELQIITTKFSTKLVPGNPYQRSEFFYHFRLEMFILSTLQVYILSK